MKKTAGKPEFDRNGKSERIDQTEAAGFLGLVVGLCQESGVPVYQTMRDGTLWLGFPGLEISSGEDGRVTFVPTLEFIDRTLEP